MMHARKLTTSILMLSIGVSLGCNNGGAAQAQQRSGQQELREQLGELPVALDTASAAGLSSAFRGAAARALPAVVQIRVVAQRQNQLAQNLPFRIPGFENEESPRRSQGTGSGFIIDADGHILTNYHVVRDAERIDVVLVNGRDYAGEFVGGDPDTDIAVIRVRTRNGEELPVSQIGDSDALRVGDWVLALGNPLGLEFTVTAGIVSAKGRSIDILRRTQQTALESFIQTDAAINPGNSGGPMVDLLGRVVGINTAISSQTGFFAGAGFAIPINLARKVANDLIRHGVVHRPRLGISINDATAADAEVFRLPAVSGAVVARVEPGDPAARAGIQMGDVIVSIEGTSVRNVADLQARVAGYQPGERITVGYIRNGESREAAVQLGEFEATRPQVTAAARNASGAALLGFQFEAVPAELSRRQGWRPEWSVIITGVDPDVVPERFPGRPGAVLLRLNGREVATPRDVERLAGSLRSGEVISIVVIDPREPNAQPSIFNYRAR
jgi:serine protease Do